jgi:hypothetical protein
MLGGTKKKTMVISLTVCLPSALKAFLSEINIFTNFVSQFTMYAAIYRGSEEVEDTGFPPVHNIGF